EWKREIVRALLEIGEGAVDPLIEALKDTDTVTREEAVRALAEMGSRKATMALLLAVTEGDREIQRAARDALINIRSSGRTL
ncbi:MAG TPA: HEAT repeat domain-containing protein, partial [Methanomicrobiales archaeon]|nr:HEAT repeat domain-containing protein [Methanomicrobiales archaeon]